MKILFCNYEYPPIGGGGGVINAALAEELAKRHEVTVLTSQGLDLPAQDLINDVSIIRVPVFFRHRYAAANFPSLLAFLPSGVRSGKRLLNKRSFDIINTHFALPSGPVGNALARYAAIPNVLSVHGGDLYDPSKWSSPHKHSILRGWIRHLINRADFVVGQSKNTLENMRKYYGDKADSALIPLGIVRPPVVSGSREEFGLPIDSTLLITVGRLVARKAVDQLVTAMQTIKPGKTTLVILGSGPQEAALQEQVSSLGLGDHVRFVGQVSDTQKVKLLRLADIYVSTSQHEGFGLVFLEAMAEGLPIVCYDFGGQTDFLEDGCTGRLIALNDLDGFVRGVQQLMESKEERLLMGRENRDRVEGFFIDTCAARYEHVFEQVISAAKLTL
ncbi:MAG: glycosyltransferase family 4 protein [Woeseiaceae bacterium]|nr:glycosyltransferase family 4 protein [Woeseiaceae bacterium]